MDITNWLRKEGTNPIYYGYANPGTDTGDTKWLIMREYATYREWADNDFLYDKIWDDRTAYFTTPTVAPTLEYSGATSSKIDVTWGYVSGMTKYYITVLQNNIPVMNKNVYEWKRKRIELTPEKKIVVHIDRLIPQTEYTVRITGKNGFGEISSDVIITTL